MQFNIPWTSWLDWLLPVYCGGCTQRPVTPNQPLCYQCLGELASMEYDWSDRIRWEKIFWGRIRLESVLPLYPLRSGSILQQALHQFKYQHRPGIGQCLGKIAGHKLLSSAIRSDPDALVPLPLHPSKKRKRGYNQAESICKGIAAVTGLPIWNDLIEREQATETQTRKDRGERWDNMAGKFKVKKAYPANNKHLLLVDDVITTGATLEACGQALLEIPGSRLSFFTLAHTETHA